MKEGIHNDKQSNHPERIVPTDARRHLIREKIHTFSAWKAAGYIVKKGEHAIACFPVWKYKESRRNNDNDDDGDNDGEQETTGKMYLRKAFWFKVSQVERITA